MKILLGLRAVYFFYTHLCDFFVCHSVHGGDMFLCCMVFCIFSSFSLFTFGCLLLAHICIVYISMAQNEFFQFINFLHFCFLQPFQNVRCLKNYILDHANVCVSHMIRSNCEIAEHTKLYQYISNVFFLFGKIY